MENRGITFYRVMVYVAYGFYILMGITWFIVSFLSTGRFNLQAFILTVVFLVQAWYKHVLTNLILGLLSLALSIFMLLQVMETQDLKNNAADTVTKSILGFCVVSVAMSLILVFSYVKFGFKEK